MNADTDRHPFSRFTDGTKRLRGSSGRFADAVAANAAADVALLDFMFPTAPPAAATTATPTATNTAVGPAPAVADPAPVAATAAPAPTATATPATTAPGSSDPAATATPASAATAAPEPKADDTIPPTEAEDVFDRLLDRFLTFIRKRRASLQWLKNRGTKTWRQLFERLGIDYWLQLLSRNYPDVNAPDATLRWARIRMRTATLPALIGPDGTLPAPADFQAALDSGYPEFEQQALADSAAAASGAPAPTGGGAPTPAEEEIQAVAEATARHLFFSQFSEAEATEPTNLTQIQTMARMIRSHNPQRTTELVSVCTGATDAPERISRIEGALAPVIAGYEERIAQNLGYTRGLASIRSNDRQARIRAKARQFAALNYELDDNRLKELVDAAVTNGEVQRSGGR